MRLRGCLLSLVGLQQALARIGCDPGAAPHERAVRWDDPAIGIAWPLAEAGIPAPTLSDKDRAAPPLAQADCFE